MGLISIKRHSNQDDKYLLTILGRLIEKYLDANLQVKPYLTL